MKEKIQNWVKDKGTTICGAGLLIASLCAVAFGGAYLGANIANRNNEVDITLFPADELCECDCD